MQALPSVTVQTVPEPSVRVLLLTVLILIGLISMLFHPRTRPWGIGLLIAGPIVLLFLMYFTYQSARIPARIQSDFGGLPSIQVVAADKTTAKTSAKPIAEEPLTDEDATETADAEKQRPDWVDQPARRVGDSYQMTVTTGPYSSRLECEGKIPEALQEAVNQFVELSRGRQWVKYARLAPEQLRQLVAKQWAETKEYSVGKMAQIYLLVNFDRKAKNMIDDALSSKLFTMRAAVGGTCFIGLWLLLGVAWGYLKADLATKGTYRKRLRVAAGLVALIILLLGFSAFLKFLA